MNPINWQNIAQAISYYTQRGYDYIEVPWVVPRDISMVTAPPDVEMYNCALGDLVGSAEQSFIHLMVEQNLQGSYVAATPCWRPENDQWHQPYFFKVELFKRTKNLTTARRESDKMAWHAQCFMEGLGGAPFLVPTESGLDLEIGGIEVGSYGARKWAGFTWAYGTGLAEPRFSMAVANDSDPHTAVAGWLPRHTPRVP